MREVRTAGVKPGGAEGGARLARACSRVVLLAAIAVGLLVAAPSLARADATPTAGPSVIGPNGSSVFSYGDLRDASDKYEGGYAAFDDSSTARYTGDPHGGYDSTTNKCRVCHAVHRAEGAVDLMRANSEADACDYCHVGGSAHSSKLVYSSNAMGEQTDVGHRIGTLGPIPASATTQTLSTQTVPTTDASGVVSYVEVPVRVIGAPNRIFRLRRTHTQSAAGDLTGGYQRIGPTGLTCLSCHTPHAAPDELWRPTDFSDESTRLAGGYKLLRRSPSGSVFGPDDMPYDTSPEASAPATVSYTTDGMVGYKEYKDFRTTGLVNPGNVIRTPETTLVAGGNYGPGKTTWLTRELPPARDTTPGVKPSAVDPATINQYALSAWCADCHNLAIGDFTGGRYAELGMQAHTGTSTHAIPMGGANNGPAQCYTCHRGDLTPKPETAAYDPTRADCERCHYGTGSYAVDPVRLTPQGADWPHAAPAESTKLLGAWTMDATTGVVTPLTSVTSDQVCARCHKVGDRTHDHTAQVADVQTSGVIAGYTFGMDSSPMTYGQQTCGDCHYMDLAREHVKPTSSVSAQECNACHPPYPPDSFSGDWNKTCQQGSCHPSYHAGMATKHVVSQRGCGYGRTGCHYRWPDDVAAVHDDFWYSQSNGVTDEAGVPLSERFPIMARNGCATCHKSPAQVPTATSCASCHSPVHPG